MKRSAESTELMNRKMTQMDLFADPRPGWEGKRYLLCTDGQWHLVTRVLAGNVADTQCCEDTQVVLPVPSGATEPMCSTCTQLHFAPKR